MRNGHRFSLVINIITNYCNSDLIITGNKLWEDIQGMRKGMETHNNESIQ